MQNAECRNILVFVFASAAFANELTVDKRTLTLHEQQQQELSRMNKPT